MIDRPFVTLHAIERFIERAMEIEVPETVSEDMQKQISHRIYQLLDDNFPIHNQLGAATFPITDLGIKIVKNNYRIVTIKLAKTEDCSRHCGGIMQSGSKLKKKRDKKAWKDNRCDYQIEI